MRGFGFRWWRPAIGWGVAAIGNAPVEVLADYLAIMEGVEPMDVPLVVPADADDDHVVAAAVWAHADIIVSGDSDLLDKGSHQGIHILPAAEALDALGALDDP